MRVYHRDGSVRSSRKPTEAAAERAVEGGGKP